MLKALLKVNAAAFVNWLAGSGKRGNKGKSSKGKMIVYALLMLYALGVFCWLFGEIFALLAPPLYNAGCGWLYFVYVFIVAFALMFVFSVFAAKTGFMRQRTTIFCWRCPYRRPSSSQAAWRCFLR